MLREPQHDDCRGFWGVILSLSKDLGVMQRLPLSREVKHFLWFVILFLIKS